MTARNDRIAGCLVLVLGILIVGTGIYFMFLRPPLLPEDMRHTGSDLALLPPAFVEWLGIVFATWGGFTAGFGIVLSGIGIYLAGGARAWLLAGTALGLLLATGRFAISNIVIGSDFLWFVVPLFLLAVVAATALLWRWWKG